MKQQSLFKEKIIAEFGGSLNLEKRKSRRPLDSKKSTHLILKSTSSFKLLRNKEKIKSIVNKMSQRFGVKIYNIGVHADHIHLHVQFGSRQLYIKWIRGLTASLVKVISDLKWKFIPFTRIVSWGREFKKVSGYVDFNETEGNFLLNGYLRMEEWQKLLARKYSSA